jgi:alkyl hydroperoxide reductase subunit AhpF
MEWAGQELRPAHERSLSEYEVYLLDAARARKIHNAAENPAIIEILERIEARLARIEQIVGRG